MSRDGSLKFCVLYDDESFDDEAKRALEVVKDLVEYLESEGEKPGLPESKYKGAYKYRDCLPGFDKQTWRIKKIQNSEFTLLLITPGFLKKKWCMFWKQVSMHIQDNRETHGRVIPLIFGVDEETIKAELNPNDRGLLWTMEVSEIHYVPENYTEDNQWRQDVFRIIAGGDDMTTDTQRGVTTDSSVLDSTIKTALSVSLLQKELRELQKTVCRLEMQNKGLKEDRTASQREADIQCAKLKEIELTNVVLKRQLSFFQCEQMACINANRQATLAFHRQQYYETRDDADPEEEGCREEEEGGDVPDSM